MAQLDWEPIDDRAVNTARVLAADAVEKSGDGHPGTAMSLAPAAYLLFQKVMRRDPSDNTWIGRDRFILSCGHSSLTQYLQLYLGGYGLEMEDLKQLRQWGSKTPGHPEYGHTDGIEITTGPLGQGLASAVGFAYAQRYERGLFDPNTAEGESPFDHHVYVIASDGDIEEGVTSEASSLAGTQELGNLIVIYDANQISIEDDTNVALSEDTKKRYDAYGWQTLEVDWRTPNGYHEDVKALYEAIEKAKADTKRPSFIVLRTIIGWPSPTKQNTGGIHGSKLGEDELKGLKTLLDFAPDESFQIEENVLEHTRKAIDRGKVLHAEWSKKFDAWAEANPAGKELFDRLQEGVLPEGIEKALPHFEPGKDISTRAASGKVINALAPELPELWGGSADLAGSNNTTIEGVPSFIPASRSTKKYQGDPTNGRVLHFGIREHAMAAILNGIVLHGNTRPFGGTFLIFSDYQRPAVRLAALMQAPSIFVWTHDSVALGGDGPTHQPIEQLWSLRAIPGLDIVRPADAAEVSNSWLQILNRRQGPAGIVLSRQNLPVFERGEGDATDTQFASTKNVDKGAYVLIDAKDAKPDVILIASGAEVALAVAAREKLAKDGVQARVVSAPCLEWFDEQDEAYRESVLPKSVAARVSVEAGISLGWSKYVGPSGTSVSIDTFGASAPGDVVYEKYGMTPDAVVAAAKKTISSLS